MVRNTRSRRRLPGTAAAAVATTLAASALMAALAPAPSAEARPNSVDGCTFDHGLHPESDNTGSWWQLSLSAVCPPDSGVRAISWDVSLYATSTDGVDRSADEDEYFVGGPGTPERLVRPGTEHWVERGAPRGRARYCYVVSVRYFGVINGPVDGSVTVPTRTSGRRCIDGIGA